MEDYLKNQKFPKKQSGPPPAGHWAWGAAEKWCKEQNEFWNVNMVPILGLKKKFTYDESHVECLAIQMAKYRNLEEFNNHP